MQPHAVSRHCCAMGKWLQDWDPALRAELPALCKEGNIQGYFNLSCQRQIGLDAKASNAQEGIMEPFCSPFPSFICFAVLSEKKKYNLASLLRMHKDR